MFTGLVKTTGTIRRVDQRGDCMVTVAMADSFPVEVGDSIACDGICLTAVKVSDNEFKVSLSAETMSKTTAGRWQVGTKINLEPSLRMGDALGGHLVSGHVDGVARVVSRQPSGDSSLVAFEVPTELTRFIAAKGSVTVSGVSLTVNEVMGTRFTVNIIPHTAKETTFGELKQDDQVNIEVDMLARYVARLLETKQ
jgi:riboflavin synthase